LKYAVSSERERLNRHTFLRRLHEVYCPRTYFEIGVNTGLSLSLSRVPTVAVDPAFIVTAEIDCDLHLVRAPSDEFFARALPFEHLRGAPVDMAFIGGMHLFEFALRDFINTERHAQWTSVIVLDDVLPRTFKEAARRRHAGAWAGDVYKILPVLHRFRPELLAIPVNTQPTGTLLVLCVDPANASLAQHYKDIIRDYVVEDAQQIPMEIRDRRCALDPNAVLEMPCWATLRAARNGDIELDKRQFRATVVDYLALQTKPDLGSWRPEGRSGRMRDLGDLLSARSRDVCSRVASTAVAHPILRKLSRSVFAQLPERYQRAIRERVHKGRGGHR
jgi:hypothetical protein